MKKILLVGFAFIIAGCASDKAITTMTPTDYHGSMLLADSSTYTGEIKDLTANGYGTIKSQNGTYTGSVKNGKANGFGKTVVNDGAIYEGEHVNGEFHGRGKLTLSNGSYFIGYMNRGKVGRGTMYFTDGRSAPIR